MNEAMAKGDSGAVEWLFVVPPSKNSDFPPTPEHLRQRRYRVPLPGRSVFAVRNCRYLMETSPQCGVGVWPWGTVKHRGIDPPSKVIAEKMSVVTIN